MRPALTPDRASILPTPDGAAREHTVACAQMLREDIAAHGGWVPFARFMDRALYAPGLGYYAAGARKFGADGDFVTAPEISPLFGRCVARALADVVRSTGGDVLELGPGSGKLARDALLELDALGALPRRYRLLEVSADLQDRQRALLAALPAHLASRVEWCTHLPAAFCGAVIANEVLDVVPIHLLLRDGGAWLERGVSMAGTAFAWQERPCTDVELSVRAEEVEGAHFGGALPGGYSLELCPQAGAMVASVGAVLTHGAMLWIDYGFRAAEFFHPSRHMGTLMCHYRHYAHPDPFLFPGLQDITAHVDFSAVAHAGAEAGLTVAGYTSQAQFLIAAGLPELLPRDASPDAHMRMAQQIQRLTSPAEMGELFKVIGFAKGGAEIPTFIKARPLPL